MADLTALTLPVLPLTTGVVLPQMVVTIALETDEAKAAVEAAGDDGRLLLVPRVDGRYAPVGAVARIESTGAAAERHAGAGRPGRATGPGWAPAWSAPASALWLAGRARRRAASPTERPESWPASCGPRCRRSARAPRRSSPDRAAARRRRPRRAGRHRRLVARPGHRAQGRAARDDRRRRAGREGPGLGQGGPGRARADRAHPHARSPTAWRRRSASSCCASRWPPSARSWATTRATRPSEAYRARLAEIADAARGRRARRSSKEIDRLERTSPQNTRARLDPHLARHACSSCPGASAPTTTSTSSTPAPCSTPTTTASTR